MASGAETIDFCRLGLRMAVWLQVKVSGLGLWHRLNRGPVIHMYVCVYYRTTSNIQPLPAFRRYLRSNCTSKTPFCSAMKPAHFLLEVGRLPINHRIVPRPAQSYV